MSERGPAWEQDCPTLPGEKLGQIIGGTAEEGFDPDATTAVVSVPTLLLATMFQRARESDLPLAATEEMEARLHPAGVHLVSMARTVAEPRPDLPVTHSWIRAHVRMRLDDDPDGGSAWLQWCDFDQPFFERLLAAARAQHQEKKAAGWSALTPGELRPLPEPRWAGSHAFSPVYRGAAIRCAGGVDPLQPLAPRRALAASESSLLADAHVLWMDPAQVAVLPEWETPEEAFDYAAEAVLPFEPVFLDFTGPDSAPRVEFADGWVTLAGALMWWQEDGETLTVAPYMTPDDTSEHWYSPGWFMFNQQPRDRASGEIAMCGGLDLRLSGSTVKATATTVWADACCGV